MNLSIMSHPIPHDPNLAAKIAQQRKISQDSSLPEQTRKRADFAATALEKLQARMAGG